MAFEKVENTEGSLKEIQATADKSLDVIMDHKSEVPGKESSLDSAARSIDSLANLAGELQHGGDLKENLPAVQEGVGKLIGTLEEFRDTSKEVEDGIDRMKEAGKKLENPEKASDVLGAILEILKIALPILAMIFGGPLGAVMGGAALIETMGKGGKGGGHGKT